MIYTNLKAFKTINAYQKIKMPVLNNNNDATTTTTTTDVETIEIERPENEIHKIHTKCRLLKKLGKIDVSKSRSLDSIEDIPPPPPTAKPIRNKTDEYYYKHREEKLEYQKNYNREKGGAIKDYNKSYYMKRREEILEKAKTKITCECGCVVQLFNMIPHKKTKKHVRYLEMRQTMMNAVVGASAVDAKR
jgi:hypothetical protein